MKFSDLTEKVRGLFRPGHDQSDRVSASLRETETHHDRRTAVEIHIPSTGERFIHDPSLPQSGDLRRAVDEKDVDADDAYAQHVAWLESNAAEALERWNGTSVRDIDTEAFHEFPNLESHPALQATVPHAARQEFWDQFTRDHDRRSSLTLLATDQKGEALVKWFTVDDRLDADGQSYNVMPIDEASKLLQAYGASRGLDLDSVGGLSIESIPAQAPTIGATYRGTILAVENGTVYQKADQDTAIAHKVDKLAIQAPEQYVGKEVEVSYPCGQVGLLRPLDHVELTPAQQGLDNARRDHSIER